ncbi:heterokaryon incompatibility protein-domain-containing protein, partial [Stachybotrys elegans]
MWLLNAVTFRLEQLPEGPLLPPYAILSHTWGDDEVTHQDVRSTDPRERADVREKLGWHKIENTCRLACQYGLSHVWIDTCCMDQTSSAELQESINSMFRWYEQADICIALLSDVAEGEDVAAETSQFRKARWFTRGWTLQELLAPAEIDFYDASWRFLGTKTELRYLIAEITGIGLGYIGDYLGFPAMSSYERLSKASVAERLSWVAERETKRQEDLAYCLLGIFNINIAMLYGEGIKAFRRLQEEIMKVSGDSSILSWGLEESCCSWRLDESSILAPLPTHFKNCREVQSCIINGVVPPTFSIHQKGLQLKAATRVDPMYDKLIYVSLGCRLPVKDDGPPAATVVVLPLVSADTEPQNLDGGGPGENEYIRPVWCRPILVSEEFLDGFETRELFIRRHSEARGDLLGLPFKLEWQCSPTQAYSILGTYPPQPIGTR